MSQTKQGGILKPFAKSKGGANVPYRKNTADMEVKRISPPATVVLPMQQHIGAPCIPTVKVGEYVYVGQVIGNSDAYVSTPIHATVSGKVKSVSDFKLTNGNLTKAITIESDGKMELYPDLQPPEVETREDFLKAVRNSGLVGLGGAGFPTHVKLAFDPNKDIDTLIVNAAECEPYITVDYRECLDNSYDILNGVYLLHKFLGFKRVIIAVEDNKPEAIKNLKRIADNEMDKFDQVRLMTLKSKYPQGAEKVLVYSATGRKIPPGKLPADVGCVVMNVGSVAFLARYIKTGKPLVSRSITVDGSAVKNPQNLRVPIGTKIQDIIEYCGGYNCDVYKLMYGGPMMGISVYSDELPILKNNNAILCFSEKDLPEKKQRDCIRCGRCVQACPMNLMPERLDKLVKTKDIDGLINNGINICMECGSCAYVCPSNRPLVHSFKLGKVLVKEAEAKK